MKLEINLTSPAFSDLHKMYVCSHGKFPGKRLRIKIQNDNKFASDKSAETSIHDFPFHLLNSSPFSLAEKKRFADVEKAKAAKY